MSPLQRLEKLRSHSEALLDGFLGLRLNYALLKPLLGDLGQPVPHVQLEGLRHGMPALRTTLFTVCVLDVVKLAWDRDRRTPSLHRFVKSLDDVDVRRALAEDFRPVVVGSGDSDEEEHEQVVRILEESERDRRRATVEEGFARLRQRWTRFDSMPCKSDFLSLRNKSFAHLEIRSVDGTYQPIDLEGLGIRRRDLDAAVVAMEGMIFDVTSIVRDAHFTMDETVGTFDQQGAAFWSRLRLGGNGEA